MEPLEDRITPGGGAVTPPADLTEENASQWAPWADGGTATVQDDTSRKVAGQSSLAFWTTGAFDTSVRYTLGSGNYWNLNDYATLHAAFYAENPNTYGFQNGSPWVRLLDAQGNYFQYQYYSGGNPADVMDQAIGAWKAFDIPLQAAATVADGWRRTSSGSPDLSRVSALEIHSDTWGYGGFSLWIDDLGFRSTPPTITPVPDQDGVAGMAHIPYPFTVGDAETPAANLTVTATSSNPALIPPANITLGVVSGGTGAERYVGFTPAAGQSGTATIDLKVTDPTGLSADTSFNVTVTLPDTPPTITPVPDQDGVAGMAHIPYPFTVGDAETPAANLTVTATSSNPALIPPANITLGVVSGGTGAERYVGFTPAAGQSGTATIDLKVTDPTGLSADTSFNVTVTLPTVSGFTPPTLPAGQVGLPYSQMLGVSSPDHYVFGLVGNLPPGLSLDPSGLLSGTPTTPGSFAFTVNADGQFSSGTHNYALTVNPPPVTLPITPVSPPAPPPIAPPAAPAQPVYPAAPPVSPPVRLTAVGADAGGGPVVWVNNPDGSHRFPITAYDPSFTGGVRVAVGDVSGDGIPDVITAPGPGGPPVVKIYAGSDGALLRTIDAFDGQFTGGFFVATGDFNRDGYSDLVISADIGGGPRVTVYSGKDGSVLANFFGINDPNFRGGARTAVGDVNGDGVPDLIVAAGFEGGPRVTIYDGREIAAAGGGSPADAMANFFAFEQTLRNGVYVGAGELPGKGYADLLFGAGPGGAPRVREIDGQQLLAAGGFGTLDSAVSANPLMQVANFFAGDPNNRDGVRVATADTGDGTTDILTAPGTGAGSTITHYDPTGSPVGTEDPFSGFNGGAFVGGSEDPTRVDSITMPATPLGEATIHGRFLPNATTKVTYVDGTGFVATVDPSNVTDTTITAYVPVVTTPDGSRATQSGSDLHVIVDQTPVAGTQPVDTNHASDPIPAPPPGVAPAGFLTEQALRAEEDQINAGVAAYQQLSAAHGAQPSSDFVTAGTGLSSSLQNLADKFAAAEAAGGPFDFGSGTNFNAGLSDQTIAAEMTAEGVSPPPTSVSARSVLGTWISQAGSAIDKATKVIEDTADFLDKFGKGLGHKITKPAAVEELIAIGRVAGPLLQITADAVDGRPLNEAVLEEAKKAINELTEKGVDKAIEAAIEIAFAPEDAAIITTLLAETAMINSIKENVLPTIDSLLAPTPQLSVTATVAPGSGPLSTAFTFAANATGGVPGYTYSWNFGDGGTSSSASATHTYSTPGPHTATVQVTDSKGATTSTSVTVTVNPAAMSGTVEVSPGSGDTTTAFAFSTQISGGLPAYTYHWDFGDGGTSTAAAPTHQYTSPGTYAARVQVTDSAGESVSGSVSVTVAAASLPILGTYTGPYKGTLDPATDNDGDGEDDIPVSGQVTVQITGAPAPGSGSSVVTITGTVQVTGMPGGAFSTAFSGTYDTSDGRIDVSAVDASGSNAHIYGTLMGHTISGKFDFTTADGHTLETRGETTQDTVEVALS